MGELINLLEWKKEKEEKAKQDLIDEVGRLQVELKEFMSEMGYDPLQCSYPWDESSFADDLGCNLYYTSISATPDGYMLSYNYGEDNEKG